MDTEDHADLMSLLNDTVDRQVLPMSDMHIGSRQVHSDERTCTHCSRRGECWDEIFERIGLPEHFRPRSGWDENRMHNHMLGVIGQVCGNFEHSNREINARQVQAERRRRENTGEGNDWDTEEN
jgi:hypothetical protein